MSRVICARLHCFFCFFVFCFFVVFSKLLTGCESHDGARIGLVGDIFVGNDTKRSAQADIRYFGRRVANVTTAAAVADVELAEKNVRSISILIDSLELGFLFKIIPS